MQGMERAPKTEVRRLVIVHGRSNPGAAEMPQTGSANANGEQIEYLADMIRQMQVLARQTGSLALARILEVAHREAVLQRKGNAKRIGWFEPA